MRGRNLWGPPPQSGPGYASDAADALLTRAVDRLAALPASGAAYVERPQFTYRDVRTRRISINDPRRAAQAATCDSRQKAGGDDARG